MEENNNYTSHPLEIDYNQYKLVYKKLTYTIKIERNKNIIIFVINNYFNVLDLNDLSKLIQKTFNSIDNAYQFIISYFEYNYIYINDIKINELIKLNVKINKNEEKEIILLYKKYNSNNINNEIKIKKDSEIIKEYNSNPNNLIMYINIRLKNLNSNYSYTDLDNSFIVFKSIKIFTNKKTFL